MTSVHVQQTNPSVSIRVVTTLSQELERLHLAQLSGKLWQGASKMKNTLTTVHSSGCIVWKSHISQAGPIEMDEAMH